LQFDFRYSKAVAQRSLRHNETCKTLITLHMKQFLSDNPFGVTTLLISRQQQSPAGTKVI